MISRLAGVLKIQKQTIPIRHNDSKGIQATNDRSDRKGGGSLDETVSKSHHKRERVAQGINSIIAEVQEVHHVLDYVVR
jgi:hypothetical protein